MVGVYFLSAEPLDVPDAQGWTPVLRFNRNRTNSPEPPAYFPVEPGKTGAFQPEPPEKFPVEPKKLKYFNRNRPENSRLNRGKPEQKKNGASQPEPPGNFPVGPEKTARFSGSPVPFEAENWVPTLVYAPGYFVLISPNISLPIYFFV